MEEKCFCHFGGFAVKDAAARRRLDVVENAAAVANSRIDNMVQAPEQAYGEIPDPGIVPESYINDNLKITAEAGNAYYYVEYYPVYSGVKYRLYGDEVGLSAEHPAVVFKAGSTIPAIGWTADSVVIMGTTTPTDIDQEYIPEADGYICIAKAAGWAKVNIEYSEEQQQQGTLSQEITDARVDYKGTVHTNAGTAIRSQAAALDAAITATNTSMAESVAAINDRLKLLEATGAEMPEPVVITQAYIAPGGKLNAMANDSYNIQYYPVYGGVTYRIFATGAGAPLADYPIVTYKAGTDVPAIGSETTPLIITTAGGAPGMEIDQEYIPEADGYIVVAAYGTFTPAALEIVQQDNRQQLKIQVFGDSTTDNGGAVTWPSLLAQYLPDYNVTMINSGKGGNTLTKYTVQPPYEWPAGTPVTDPAGAVKGIAYQITERAQDEAVLDALDPTADLYIICASSNDYNSRVSLGEFRNGDITTIFGAMQKVLEYIQTNTQAQVLVLTPIQRYAAIDEEREGNGWVDAKGNILNAANGYTLEALADAVKETCAFYAVPCLDAYRSSGLSKHNIRNYSTDGLHPNELAAHRLARLVAKAVQITP